jgi:hypothetical protein
VPWPITLLACAKVLIFFSQRHFSWNPELKKQSQAGGSFSERPAFFSGASFFIRSLLISLAFIVFKLLLA